MSPRKFVLGRILQLDRPQESRTDDGMCVTVLSISCAQLVHVIKQGTAWRYVSFDCKDKHSASYGN